MTQILIIGAGRSATSLIQYMLEKSQEKQWHIRIADIDTALAARHLKGYPQSEALSFDVRNPEACKKEVSTADIVLSLLPAHLHLEVALACVHEGKTLITASYVSEEMQKLDEEAQKKGVLLLNEMGLDPGIDHMSAKKAIDELRQTKSKITAFKSYTGGLIAPEYDNNPWHYKFTWNPRNVVLAGQGTAKFLQNGMYKYVPYQRVFTTLESIHITNIEGEYEAYPNRDSLKYRESYGLEDIPTILRGTIRKKGFPAAWQALIQLGLTDDSFELENTYTMTYREFVNSFLKYNIKDPVELKVARFLNVALDSDCMQKLQWLGLFENKEIGLSRATPAQILQKILEDKWALAEGDKDMILMQHLLKYQQAEKSFLMTSTMVVFGDSNGNTAMAKTVGLPMAIAAELWLEGKIKAKGVKIPIEAEIYEPVLKRLAQVGIQFDEKITQISTDLLYE
ncbi:MAG: saccharopine dehydrogenase NADP-binding domain-containing protein [Bernardetiaceae bacterium]|nr:saccharopine dehydrogenase NADP-binding domain-containing protein [Bernardetiaceae bacterium]